MPYFRASPAYLIGLLICLFIGLRKALIQCFKRRRGDATKVVQFVANFWPSPELSGAQRQRASVATAR